HRERIYIMGRKIDQFSRSVPLTDAETIQIAKKKLRDFLDVDEPPYDEEQLSENQMAALQWCRERVEERRDECPEWTVAVFDLSRAPGRVYKPTCRLDDKVMTLTTRNGRCIWIQGVSKKLPSFDRFLLPKERAALQGIEPWIVDRLPGLCSQYTATGNAMSLPRVGLCLACMLEDIQHPGTYK
ncbi:unnamed protein product, partial [Prorocentrum cordatum]